MRRLLITTCVVLASFGVSAGAALADSCENTSRAAPNPTGGPIIKGNWVWLPSIGVPVESWGFAPPGTFDSTVFGFPTDPPIRILLKKVPQRGPDGRAVVDYKNANCGNLLGFN